VRVVSGSVLDGRTAAGEVHGYLGRHHLQVSVLAEAANASSSAGSCPARRSSRSGASCSAPGAPAGAQAQHHHQRRHAPMVPIGSFERVMPLDLMPTFLLRALLMKSDERAEKLGCLELDEEDLALCTFVCPGKTEYGPLLRQALARIEKEAA
jgi:Na+-transporting NADH:ubiquinone oxidoreductase subunit A